MLSATVGHVEDRVDIWLDPFGQNAPERAGQITRSLYAQADGGLFGRGLGSSLSSSTRPFKPDCSTLPQVREPAPAPHTDFIYAVIVNELGVFGAAAVVIIYILIAERGFKTAVLARRVREAARRRAHGGVRAPGVRDPRGRRACIPLTGVTLPFISYGGSSIVANMVLLGLLLVISDRARRPPAAGRPRELEPLEVR